MYQSIYSCDIGYIVLTSDSKKLIDLQFSNQKINFKNQNCPILNLAKKELDLYFAKKLFVFKTPLFIQGSEFERKVYKALLSIPYGQTKTYQEIAMMIKNPKSYRAVGNANAKNKLAIFIPCHRIVAKNHIGGYSGGIFIKQALLNLESFNK
ncbi:O-6-alkylguanine-DNA/cysteine-protein-methyltransferase [Campylobacter volucris]|uniref:Methylated-DNA--protein-cysteine methyltransferase n=1 Tax=Campylobacter volucris TaxID=1031542 RepID=A0AAE5YGH8_9BACT|nr:O-6-alkylguanine-DNA/cysteine-protein-methyltransferase [Campylobacter volucris]AJC94252.1 O6-alkylguanine-DNA-alkyltransferase [Campylobacter volucris LMG 24379]KAB0580407.1 O-6-alkylguanine-DNA/cysteine-protein-methyltransferase [Campylobacter volucris]QBL13381.1 O-6-alkylguanine-DNA/cysteine-protein-methyltransferase [Campylobacter volucris]QEL08468.1 O6-alkylguanine-DNA-alkyltransferase [Campylobacter volucris]TXK70417.1 O-6-alkylguanine-DNA/cysteine-protein-methyltransferase [Campyloba